MAKFWFVEFGNSSVPRPQWPPELDLAMKQAYSIYLPNKKEPCQIMLKQIEDR